MLKSASQQLYQIHWSLGRNLCSKNSLLLTCQTLGLLANTLATNEKYPVLNRGNLTVPIQMQLSEKQKTFSRIFAAFLKSQLNFNNLKKKVNLTAFVFPKLRSLKTWLDKCLKSLVSEGPFKINMINVSKHCWNLHHNTFFIFMNHCQRNWVGKSLFYWHEKSWDCLLTNW